LYTPICVLGGEWNHARAVCGTVRVPDVGEGDRATRFVLDMRAATASESLDESSSDDAEPDIESSRPERELVYQMAKSL
jgi:hypothetical protein